MEMMGSASPAAVPVCGGDADPRPFGRQPVGYGQPDAAAGTGDDGGLALKTVGLDRVLAHDSPFATRSRRAAVLLSRSSRRRIFPVCVLGRSPMTWTERGYL